MEFVILRHGETQWNVEHRLQGRADSPLTDFGRSQAYALGVYLRDLRVARIYSSPQQRVRDTLKAAGEDIYRLARFRNELMELDFGEFTGLTKDKVPLTFEAARRKDEWNVPYPGGESLRDLSRRTALFLREISKEENKEVFIFAHEMVNATIIGHILQLEPEQTAKIRHPQGSVYFASSKQLTVKILTAGQMAGVCFARIKPGQIEYEK